MRDNPLEQEVAGLLPALKTTIAVAESCTGGLICHRLTNISGSSEYLEAGVVSYSNRSKIAFLGVPEQIIKDHGAVSEACVRAMALGVKERTDTDLGLSVSGIAGPSGGTAEKPVGTVHMALASKAGVVCWQYLFKGSRREIKAQTSEEALLKIRDYCQSMKG